MNGEKVSYPLLIAEDVKQDLVFLRNAIKRECGGQIWVDIKECTTGAETRRQLQEGLFLFVSLDREMPEQANGKLIEDLGDHLRELAVRLNPLSHVAVFTAHPEFRSAYQAGSDGSIYIAKTFDMTAKEYGRIILTEIRAFEQTIAWRKAATVLPPILATLAKDVAAGDDSDEAVLTRSASARSLWESGIHLIALMELAAISFIDPAILREVRLQTGRLENESAILLIQQLTPALQSALAQTGYPTQAREVSRFIGNASFMLALRVLQNVRNISAHNVPVVARTVFLDNTPSFVTFLMGLSLWALHPLVIDLRVVPWGTSNGLRAKALRGAWNLAPTPTWIWDTRLTMQINPAHVYHALIEPEAEGRALLIPLHPFVRVERAGETLTLWLAHDLSRGLYRNINDGTIGRFEDGALQAWWNQHRTVKGSSIALAGVRAVRESVPPKDEVRSVQPETTGCESSATAGVKTVGESVPPKDEVRSVQPETTGRESSSERLRENIRTFYQAAAKRDPREQDERYQASFDGSAKAREFLQFAERRKDLNLSEFVYVSIGGGDGSEIKHALLNSPVRVGILVEASDHGAASGREGGDFLKRNGKELVVLQGDAMQRMRDCGGILSEWSRHGSVSGVILSVQSLLHELPSRSPLYDPNILLASVFEPFRQRVFYSREPAMPREWPPVVHIRMKGVAGGDLEGFARQVNDALTFKDDRIGTLTDGFVQMSDELAVEVLFKLLYCRDVERYRYEMQEKLTGFDPEIFCRILRNYIEPPENVECEYCLTETFRAHYRHWEVEARTPTNDRLGLPKPFVRITGVQSGR
jgi:hypothetical protein